MARRNPLIWIIPAALALVAAIIGGIVWWQDAHRPLEIIATGTNPALLADLATALQRPDLPVIVAPADSKNKPDLVLSQGLPPPDSRVFTLTPPSLDQAPSAMARLGLATDGSKRLALPIALDHVELAFRRDLFAAAGLNVDDRILALAELEKVLQPLAAKDFYPLLIAGGDDQALLDAISVLVLATTGPEALKELSRQAAASQDPQALPRASASAPALEKLHQWGQSQILHPDWLVLKSSDVKSIASLRISAAVIMRLSEHRRWPVASLKDWQSSPFPPADPAQASAGLLAPALFVSMTSAGRNPASLEAALDRLLQGEFQGSAVQGWGLAPVHASAPVLDREAGDLRYWAAASRQILPSLADVLPPQQAAALAAAYRLTLR